MGIRQRFLCTLVRAHERELMRFFATRVAEPSQAQDLVQEVYLRLLRLERPDLVRNSKAYLYRVAAHIAREHWLKLSSRAMHVPLDETTEEALSVGDRCERLEHLDELETLLKPLPPKARAALIWAHRDGHTYEEISQRLAVSKSRVKKYLIRALAHCRKSAAALG